jgi:ABC-type lipoprotein export system ATPase subunit
MNISLQSVCPSFLDSNGSQVWNNEIHLAEKTFVNISAPSGTGKTTLISILYGLLSDYAGVLTFGTEDARSFNRNRWALLRQRHVALMFQDLRLFPQLSCLENVRLKAEQAGGADASFIETAFDRLGIGQRMQAQASTCSQGEKQRVAFIRALVQPFGWILLDEPFSHLDEACIQAMRDLLLEACARNDAGMILTSLEPDHRLPFHRTYAL